MVYFEFIDYCPVLLDDDLSFLNYARVSDVLNRLPKFLVRGVDRHGGSHFALRGGNLI